jgi:hypothetical protein
MTRSLADIQRDFATMLRADRPPGGRADIYHNNRRANFCKALALTYPVTARIVGEEFFTRQAIDYLALHPSRQGDLHHAGRRFPQFLAAGFASQGSEFAYLADLAKLEWAWAEALVCADASIVGSESLTAFEPPTWPLLRFSLHPSVTLIRSTWPIHTIFDEHRRDQPALVSLSAGGEYVAVLRRAQIVEAHRLNAGEYLWWTALQSGRTLGEAVEELVNEPAPATETGSNAAEFVLRDSLARLFALGAVTAVTVP